MVEIVPAILTNDFNDLKRKIKILEKYVKKVQIDVMDGVFLRGKTIQAEDLQKVKTKLKFQIHLMADSPEVLIDDYAELKNVKEFIFHAKTMKPPGITGLIKHVHEHGMKAGVALSPETPVRTALKGFKIADLALVLTVHPGAQARPFIRAQLKKIAQIKRINPKIKVGVDGGINLETCKLAIAHGADFLAVGSTVWKAKDKKKMIEQLRKCQ